MSSLIGRGRQDTYGGSRSSALGPNAHSVGALPTVAPQSGAGSLFGATATLTSVSNDNSGKITLTTGSAGLASGAQVSLTFNQPFAVPPAGMSLLPGDVMAAGVVADISASLGSPGFNIFSSAALAANTTYSWYYTVL